MRKRASVLVLAMWALLLVGGTGALGQPTGPIAEDYVYSDGEVVIGGDVVVACRDAAEFGPTDATSEARAQFERAMEQCEQAGHDALPDTGGATAPLLGPLLAAGVSLVCMGMGLAAIHRTS